MARSDCVASEILFKISLISFILKHIGNTFEIDIHYLFGYNKKLKHKLTYSTRKYVFFFLFPLLLQTFSLHKISVLLLYSLQ